MDSLSAGFVSSAPPAPKKTDVVSILTTVMYLLHLGFFSCTARNYNDPLAIEFD